MTATPYVPPVIHGHDLSANPFPAGFIYASTPPRPKMDSEFNSIVLSNITKCYAAGRADAALAIIYNYQPLGGTSQAALVQQLHTGGGAWTDADGTALQQLAGHWSGSGIPDYAALAKQLGLQNVPH